MASSRRVSSSRIPPRRRCRNFKFLLGAAAGSPVLQEEEFWALARCGGTDPVSFRVKFLGEDANFTPEQICAMYLHKPFKTGEKVKVVSWYR